MLPSTRLWRGGRPSEDGQLCRGIPGGNRHGLVWTRGGSKERVLDSVSSSNISCPFKISNLIQTAVNACHINHHITMDPGRVVIKIIFDSPESWFVTDCYTPSKPSRQFSSY